MSRSRRKFPLFRMTLWGGSHNRSMKAGKKYANKKIRHKLKNLSMDISNGHYYKYLGVDNWSLYEYKHYQTERDVINEWEQKQRKDFTLEEEIQFWKKSYLRK